MTAFGIKPAIQLARIIDRFGSISLFQARQSAIGQQQTIIISICLMLGCLGSAESLANSIVCFFITEMDSIIPMLTDFRHFGVNCSVKIFLSNDLLNISASTNG